MFTLGTILICFAVVLSSAFPADLYNNHACTHKGVKHADGEKWGQKCVRFGCDKGKVKLLSSGCDSGAICRSIGSRWTTHCITHKCIAINGQLTIKTLSQGCKGHDNRCVTVGESWQVKTNNACYMHRCVLKGNHPVIVKGKACPI